MSNFELANRIKMLKKYSNVDALYGPYNSIADALAATQDVAQVGLTVGIYTDQSHSKIKEVWYQVVDGQLTLEDKIEEYKLLLQKFEAVAEENRIKITYQIGGKGLLPKVSITGTSVQATPVSFDTEEVTYVDVSVPKEYYFRISASDVLGTFFDSNGLNTTISVSWGDIIVKTTNTQYVTNILPQQSSYAGKPVGVEVEYNSTKISNVSLCLVADGQNTYTFPNIRDNNGKIVETILLPTDGSYYGHENLICAAYTENGVSKTKTIYSFNILLPGEFALEFPKGVPTVGFSGSSLPITINLQYGGKPQNSSTVVRTKIIEISLNNSNVMNFEMNVNTTLELAYILPTIDFQGQESVTQTLKIKLLEGNIQDVTSSLEIREITSPQVPVGTYYFNSSKQRNTVTPSFNYPYFNALNIPSPGQSLVWASEEAESVLTIPFAHFNIDFDISYAQSGENLPLIIINQNDKNLLTVSQEKITSDLFSVSGKTYQTNGLALPKDNQDLHIGFGYQRAYDNSTYYSCIFINGEIAFSSETFINPKSGSVDVKFNNNFILHELCLSLETSPTNLVNCVNAAGSPMSQYKLILDSQYDLFYYNWLTTLSLDYTVPAGENLLKLQLIPFTEPANSDSDPWWQALRSALGTFGSNIKAADSKRDFKTFQFVNFGTINHGIKAGIRNIKELFEFQKDDKETRKLDKLCGVICKYKFVQGTTTTFDNNKYCIAQVQGTSTLAYPVPNFQFTFIKEVNGSFELDAETQLNFTSPVFGNIKNQEDLTFTTLTVEGETNLVAKADSMDSAHLNNTPTCVYFNSLVDTLSSHSGDEFDFHRFDLTHRDAIVGCPILIEIDANEKMNIGKDVETENIQYNSYGTFMFNTGKSAKDMGLGDDNNKVFSLEGQSNEESEITGAPGLFTLPTSDDESSVAIVTAFNKLSLTYDNTNDTKTVTVNDSGLTSAEKSLVMEYLINDGAFESRSTIDDDDLVDTENHWNDYALPVLRMWLFINQTSTDYYRLPGESSDVAPTHNLFKDYFDVVFDKNYAIIYYINLLLFGQADNLGKNMMLDCKFGEDIWYIRPYDLDSEFGLTNNGFDDFPVYANISKEHFQERFLATTYTKVDSLPEDTFNKYNSKSSLLWTKFWAVFKDDIQAFYKNLRDCYVTPERMINIGRNLVNNLISKEQYNIDFSLKHLGTEFSYLNKGGRFLNYQDWIEKRFMYVDSYFSYFKADYNISGYNGFTWTVSKTLIPIFYEAAYQKAVTRYGYEDWTYDSLLNSNMQYVFKIVPEAVTAMSPIWGNILTDFENGLYKNLQKYSGTFTSLIFGANSQFNLREIEILQGGNRYTLQDSLYIPKSVRKLRLQNLATQQGAAKFIDIQSDGGLEELYIHNCTISNLVLDGLDQLKVLEITSASNTEIDNEINYTYIESLTLSNLQLSKLKIGGFTKIGTLTIIGSTTYNDVIDLSGIDCEELVFSNSTVKELHLDQLYNFNGEPYSGYDFKDGNLFKLNGSVSSDYVNSRASNILRKEDNVYELAYFNRYNCSRISPSISTEAVDSLDLSNCTQLQTLSCIGYSKLKKLVIPTSVKCLNLQYCKKLKSLNCTEVTDANMYFNFEGFTGLYCNMNYGILGYHYYSGNSSAGYDSFSWYQINNLETKSFNLLGCDAVTKIKNLTNNSVYNTSDNSGNKFTGSHLVAGCRNLVSFEDCTLTFTSIIKSFKMTENLSEIPNSFTFQLANNATTTSAFSDTGANIEGVLNSLKNLAINASSMFLGVEISSNLGTAAEPIVLQWRNCSNLFAETTQTGMLSESSALSTKSRDYEFIVLSLESYAKSTFTHTSETTYQVYIKLPQATNVSGMFRSQNIVIKNVETVFEENTTLTAASYFVANTRQDKFINFSSCNNLTNVSYCYASLNDSTNKVQNHLPIKDDIGEHANCWLPTSVTTVAGFFDRTNLNGVDVKNIFSGLTRITNARACFRDSECDCSGSPFGNISTTASINISALFGSASTHKAGNISDLSWLQNNMETGHYAETSAVDGTTIQSYGVFENKTIQNLETVNGNGSSQRRMFAGADIQSFASGNTNQEFTIIGTNAISIFEGATISGTDQDHPFVLKFADNVQNLSRGCMGLTTGVLDLEILNTNHITNLSYFLCRAYTAVRLTNDQTENYSFFNSLTTIAHMFDLSPLNANDSSNPAVNVANLPDYLFKKAVVLQNLDYFWKNGDANGSKFDFSNCTNIKSMKYAFANSGIKSIPVFNNTLSNLETLTGAFRKITLEGNQVFSISASSLINADEVFAESDCNTNIVINISNCSKLKNINAFSTHSNIDLSLVDTYPNISALLPNTANTTAGDIILRGAGEDIESTNTLTVTENTNTHISWNSLDVQRQVNKTTNVYTLAGNSVFKFLC